MSAATVDNNARKGSAHGFDHKLLIQYEKSEYIFLKVVCNGWAALDSAALPAFSDEFQVPHVTLTACPAPAGGSLAGSLSALNVTLLRSAPRGNLTLENLPPYPPLQAQHFAGLEDLVELELIFGAIYVNNALYNNANFESFALSPGFLRALQSLRLLLVQDVRLPRDELAWPPASLQELILNHSGVQRLPDAIFALPNLHTLYLIEDDLTVFEVPQTLRHLYVDSENNMFQLKSIPKLTDLFLVKWLETHPPALARCDELHTLELRSPAVKVLPEGWVAPCLLLKQLFIVNAINLNSLPAKLLQNATTLQNVSMTKGVLETLPVGLFDHVPNLLFLDLSSNRFRTLPSGTFANLRGLQTLELSSNLFGAEVADLLAGLYSLKRLELDSNPRLTDLCDNSMGYSHLRGLTKLKYLFLSRTNITHICRDWRDNLTSLEVLKLDYTKITELRFSDLQYIRDKSITGTAEVTLNGAPIVLVRYSEEEYNASLVATRSGAKVELDGRPRLQCDCRMYWARRGLYSSAARAGRARVSGLRCASGLVLSAVPADELQCSAVAWCRAIRLPPRCTCTARAAAARRRLLRVRCHSAALTAVPPLPHTDGTIYDLLLSNNNISSLHMRDLPPHIRELDLRNNSLERVEEETALRLVSVERVLVGGNPLACECRSAPLLAALRAVASDLRTATCGSGAPLHEAALAPCSGSGAPLHEAALAPCTRAHTALWLGLGLAALLAAAAITLACFLPYHKVLQRR